MTDSMQEHEEPVLVRPYVQSIAEFERADATWPEDSTLPTDPGDADTLVHGPLLGRDEPRTHRPPPRLTTTVRLLIGLLGVVIAAAVTAWLIIEPEAPAAPSLPGAALPRPGAPAAPPAATSAGASASASVSASVSSSASASASVSASPTASGSLTPSAPAPGSPPGTTPGSARPTSGGGTTGPALDPPPSADRSGRLSSGAGNCASAGGLLGSSDGDPVEASACGLASRSVLTSEGTLRVSDGCAVASGGGVRLGGCGGSAAQWRGGPSGSLVNPATGKCLTDPGETGAPVTVTTCTGSDTQRWSLA